MARLQMRHTGDMLELTAEMPGVEGGNVSAILGDDVLTISGEQREEQDAQGVRTERHVRFTVRSHRPTISTRSGPRSRTATAC